MKWKTPLVFVLAGCLFGCNPAGNKTIIPSVLTPDRATNSSTPALPSETTVLAEPSPTMTLTATPLPSPTESAPTVSPSATFPPLNSRGPYLFTGDYLINPDGSGWTRLNYMENIQPWRLSPNGEWGAVFNPRSIWDMKEGDVLTLSLLHVPDGTFLPVADVISMETITEKYIIYDCVDVLYNLFAQTAWSPDSRYLAFTANPDGESTDLFVYDTDLRVLRRLTTDDAEIAGIVWSDDSKVVYYINGFQMDEYATFKSFTLNATKPENASNRGIRTLLTTTDAIRVAWKDANYNVLVSHYENYWCNAGGGYPGISISYTDYESQKTNVVFQGAILGDYAVDPINRMVLVHNYDDEENQKDGLFIISFDGSVHAAVNKSLDDCYNPSYLGDAKYTFLCIPPDGKPVIAISLNGKLESLNGVAISNPDVSVSPDRKRFAVYNDQRLTFFSRAGEEIYTWKYDQPLDSYISGDISFLWEPDGAGVYIIVKNTRIHRFLFADPAPNLIFACPGESGCIDRLLWVDWDLQPSTGG